MLIRRLSENIPLSNSMVCTGTRDGDGDYHDGNKRSRRVD